MGSSVSRWSETNNTTSSIPINTNMSDREIMNAKGGLRTPKSQSSAVKIFEQEYPDLSNEFIKIQK